MTAAKLMADDERSSSRQQRLAATGSRGAAHSRRTLRRPHCCRSMQRRRQQHTHYLSGGVRRDCGPASSAQNEAADSPKPPPTETQKCASQRGACPGVAFGVVGEQRCFIICSCFKLGTPPAAAKAPGCACGLRYRKENCTPAPPTAAEHTARVRRMHVGACIMG